MVSGITSSTSQLDTTQMAKKMFQKLDANQDGGIDASELGSLSQNGQGPSADEILAKFDTDGDGKISETENKKAMESAPPPPRTQTSNADGKSQMFAELLKKFDTDSDGALNESEIDGMKKDGKGPSGSDILSKFDENGDGKIDASEDAKMHETQGPPPPPNGTTAAQGTSGSSSSSDIFSQLDSDGDGSITKTEIESYISSNSVDTLFGKLQKQMQLGTSYSSDGTTSNSGTDSLLDVLA